MIQATLEVSPRLSRFFAQFGPMARTGLGLAIYDEAEGIIGLAKEKYVPVETGQLRASGHVNPPAQTADAVEVTFGFGNSAIAYAAIVHERVYRSDGVTPIHHPVGQAKYLEQAALDALPGMPERIALRFYGYLPYML